MHDLRLVGVRPRQPGLRAKLRLEPPRDLARIAAGLLQDDRYDPVLLLEQGRQQMLDGRLAVVFAQRALIRVVQRFLDALRHPVGVHLKSPPVTAPTASRSTARSATGTRPR